MLQSVHLTWAEYAERKNTRDIILKWYSAALLVDITEAGYGFICKPLLLYRIQAGGGG
jgi:hypothetical protein